MGLTDVIIVCYCQREQERRRTPPRSKCRPTWTASQRIARRAACRGGAYIQVQAVDENVRTAGTGVSDRQHHIPGYLSLNVQVELLHLALFEIEILGLNCSRELRGIQRRRDGLKACL